MRREPHYLHPLLATHRGSVSLVCLAGHRMRGLRENAKVRLPGSARLIGGHAGGVRGTGDLNAPKLLVDLRALVLLLLLLCDDDLLREARPSRLPLDSHHELLTCHASFRVVVAGARLLSLRRAPLRVMDTRLHAEVIPCRHQMSSSATFKHRDQFEMTSRVALTLPGHVEARAGLEPASAQSVSLCS